MRPILRLCLALLPLLSASPALSNDAAPPASGPLQEAGLGDVSKLFVKSVNLAVPPRAEVAEVIYGNSDVGYFSTKKIERRHGVPAISLVPPTYQHPLEVYARLKQRSGGSKLVQLPSLTLASPVPDLIARNVTATVRHGSFSPDFFLVDFALAGSKLPNGKIDAAVPAAKPGDRQRVLFVGIVNRLGEVVWAHAVGDGRALDSHTISKPIGHGQYAIMAAQHESFFEIVDITGRTLQRLDPRQAPVPFMMHHDFILKPDHTLLTLGNTTKGSGSQSYMGSSLMKVDLATGRSQQLWDVFSSFDPATTPQVPNADSGKTDKYHAVWDGPELDVDYTHGNALSLAPGVGILVSLRNLNKLVMLDKTGHRVLWTVGATAKDTFRTAANDEFHGQHNAQWLGHNRILLFDNNALGDYARIIELKLDRAHGVARVTKSLQPSPPLAATTRGSATLRDDGKLIAFFVGKDSPDDRTPSEIVEFDYATGAELARMDLAFQVHLVGYRTVPMQTLGTETYVGKTPPAVAASHAH